ncbi:MAG TPA: class I SAM-dependent methyltransferase [Actinomycetales bacterium]|nr:class I SAM-dependent methyltransferase [Actinomycetales bacterium]
MSKDPEPTGPSVGGDSELQSFTLESLTSAVNYHRWLTDLVEPYLGDDPVELGSGLGDYAATWARDGRHVTATDADPSRAAHLRRRFAGDPHVSVRDLDVSHPYTGQHSCLVAMNVLEHIEDHVGALRAAHSLLRPGGHVVMFVPAFELAMSRFDREVGHVRRYRVRTLRRAYLDAGLEVGRVHYVNAPGLLAWVVGMRLMGMTPHDGPTVRLWDRAVMPVARAVERRVRPPFGQSVFAVGRVPLSRDA